MNNPVHRHDAQTAFMFIAALIVTTIAVAPERPADYLRVILLAGMALVIGITLTVGVTYQRFHRLARHERAMMHPFVIWLMGGAYVSALLALGYRTIDLIGHEPVPAHLALVSISIVMGLAFLLPLLHFVDRQVRAWEDRQDE